MKINNIVIWLSLLILPLALVAAGAGVFWQGEGEPRPFSVLRGETVLVHGRGLYRYDGLSSAAQEMAQDVVTLVLGLPLLVAGLVLNRKGSLRGQLLLTGGLAYFLYTYAAMSFLTAFNPLFLVYVALFSLSLFGLILMLSSLEPTQIVRHLSSHFPRRAIAIFFLIVAAFLTLAWFGLAVPPMFSGATPAGLESATTMVIQALDLGVIVPTSLITAFLLWKKRPWGYTLSVVVLVKLLTMGAALIAMIIGQVLAGVEVDPVVSTIFTLICLTGMGLSVMTLRNIQDQVMVA
jgi:hypothetical protein